ncbi:hypothetical protein [Photorhabdus asymbiotica]|uniref:hypothetical protein n=1 Tax=Photorhabdus asymbiotica TaxID=291112 RepID=UPI003DA7A5EB
MALTRGEYFQAQDDEQVVEIAARALVQADIPQPPETCFLFSQPDGLALEKTGWNITQHIQDLNWGNIGGMEGGGGKPPGGSPGKNPRRRGGGSPRPLNIL